MNLTNLFRKEQSASNHPQAQTEEFCWSKTYRQQHPFKTAGVVTALTGRYLYAGMFIYAFSHKARHQWMWTDILQQHFRIRLADLDPESFHSSYLTRFAIPFYRPVAWFVTLGQLSISVSMVLGMGVRPNAALGLFMLSNFVAGGFGNPSIAPFITESVILMALPTGQWLGLDQKLHQKYPTAIWFK
ncbi:MAG: DoxX family membrane protein [Chloroflexi bacterium]|nr:DoxX family membrane protein [Chloroflexota bacterium]